MYNILYNSNIFIIALVITRSAILIFHECYYARPCAKHFVCIPLLSVKYLVK